MKNNGLWIRTILIVLVTLFGIYLVIGPRHSFTASDFGWEGIKRNLADNINLGLDLKGGTHLVMRVKTDDYLATLTREDLDAAVNAAKDAKLPVTDGTAVTENGTYSATLNLTDPAQADAVIDAVVKKVNFADWTRTTSGNQITWTLPTQIQTVLKDQAVEQAMQVIDSRINLVGVAEPTLQRHGANNSGQILLQMPGLDDPQRVKALLNADSELQLMEVISPPNPNLQTYPTKEAALASIGGKETADRKVYPYSERDDSTPGTTAQNEPPKAPTKFIVVKSPPVVDGSLLRSANAVSQTSAADDYQISFSLKPAGATKFGEWTGKNIGNYMAVVLNNEAKSVAFIQSQITDSGQISGRFSKQSAEDLALTLRSGSLPAKIEYQEERTVGPSLGADSIRAGVLASVGGLTFVIIFMLFYYRGSGVNAVVALILNMILTLAALIVLDATLTLPGIAGLILSIGMAVDSNVLIFERMREELRAGKLVKDAVSVGFDKAFITIIDTHVTTIISAAILYLYGSGPIRGFAVTLVLGLLINLFSAVFVSRTIFMWLLERNPNMKKLSI